MNADHRQPTIACRHPEREGSRMFFQRGNSEVRENAVFVLGVQNSESKPLFGFCFGGWFSQVLTVECRMRCSVFPSS